VVEGPKAGGHLGFKANDLLKENNSLESILSDVLAVTKDIKERFKKNIPVIAAGGIYTGSDIYNILKKGASGVQMGTRFVATEECDASEEFKNAFVKARDEDIQIIKSPVGMPGRSIYNSFLEEAASEKRKPKVCKHHCIKSCNPKTTLYCISEALISAYRGNLKDGFAFSGSNGARINGITTVKNLFTDLINEYKEAKRKK
jgi:nitronate monooxygenase